MTLAVNEEGRRAVDAAPHATDEIGPDLRKELAAGKRITERELRKAEGAGQLEECW